MRIRRASSADLPAILALQERRPGLPRWTEGHFRAELESPRSYFAVAEGEGYAGLILVPPEAQVTVVAVSPEKERQGVGTALLAHLVETARRAGCALMTLEVSDRNAPALALYAKAGFSVVGRRAKFYNDGSDAVLMDLKIP